MNTNIDVVVKETIAKVADQSFQEYLATRTETMTDYVNSFITFMHTTDRVMTMDTPCMQIWKQLSKDYCAQAKLNWLDFIASSAFCAAGYAVASHLTICAVYVNVPA